MAVFAIVNRKGGTGKSTLATHVAGYLAECGEEVMLGDVDRQQSARMWLGLRPESRPKIHGWTIDERNFARPPVGIKHVVLDTPGGFQGIALMKVAMYADAIVVPSTPSLFDRRAAADCLKELRQFPRVALGKCRLASIGMRIDGRTKNASVLEAWADDLGLEHLGTIKEAQIYPRCLEQGLSLFDFPRNRSFEGYLHEWAAITGWIDEVVAVQAGATQAVAEGMMPLPAAPVLTRQPGSGMGSGGLSVTPVLPRPSILSAALVQRRAQAASAAASGTSATAVLSAGETPAFLRS